MTPEDLVEIRAIEQLKYRYLRHLDLKEFDELGRLLTDDATASYGGGAYRFEGRASIVKFLQDNLSRTRMLTSHKVHQPEIELIGDADATGIWALEDRVVDTELGVTIRGAAYYDDTYVKVGGVWLISHTGYRRVFEELEPRGTEISLTASWWDTDGRSKLAAGD